MIRKTVNALSLIGLIFIAGIQSAAAQDLQDYASIDLYNIDLDSSSTLLAANTSSGVSRSTAGYQVMNIPDEQFSKPLITKNNAHMWLGLASLASAAIAAMTVPDGEGGLAAGAAQVENTHHRAAWWATYFGAAAVVSGVYAHYEDIFNDADLLDTDNLHTILGTLGVIGYYLAVTRASDNWNKTNNAQPGLGVVGTDHASAGMLGALSMTAAIAITW